MTTCDLCQRPVGGTAYACADCAKRAADQLATVAELAPAARAVAAGLSRRGAPVGGSGGGSRLPIDLGATARLDAAQNALTTWARHVSEERGHPLPSAYADPLVVAARWLAVGHRIEWLRHRSGTEARDAFTDIAAAARVVRSVVNGPGDRRWLGQCGAPTDNGPCRADVHARAGATVAKCHACGASVDVALRRTELGRLVRGYAYTATEIAAAYPRIKAGRIRVWAARNRIVSCGEIDGRPVYDLGEVLDRAAAEDARRAELAAKRAAEQDEREAEGVTSDAA